MHMQFLPKHRGEGSGSRCGSPEMSIQPDFARDGPRESGRREVRREYSITPAERDLSGLALPSPGEEGRSRNTLRLER